MSGNKRYEYDAALHVEPDGGAWVPFPWDVRREFGRGRVRIRAAFDGAPYDGSVVNMGVKNPDGSVCWLIGVTKAVRKQIGKADGDVLRVTVEERES